MCATFYTDHLGNKFTTVKDMCAYWNISYSVYYDRNHRQNWSVEKALTTPITETRKGVVHNSKKCTDHLGNDFISVTEMCRHWNIHVSVYQRRINDGWTMENALTTPTKKIRDICVDHLGNEFSQISEMCEYWNITPATYFSRKQYDWPLQKILETPVNKPVYTDHLGNIFTSVTKMCEHWNIDRKIYAGRIKKGWSQKDALETPSQGICNKPCVDHLGNEFSSISKMCKHWNLSVRTYHTRLNKGWSLQKTLETTVKVQDTTCTDHLGNTFSSQNEMLKHYNIGKQIFVHRIKHGWSLKDALETPVKHQNKQLIDHLGNSYNTTHELCEHWKIPSRVFRERLQKGMSVKEALEKPIKIMTDVKPHHCMDPLKNEFESIAHMCAYWNIIYSVYTSRINSYNWSSEKAITTGNFKPNDVVGRYTIVSEVSYKYYLVKTDDSEEFICHLYNLIKELHKDDMSRIPA